MRVLPTDVDVNRMHNGRYFTLMDLGRIDLMIRHGFFFKCLRQGKYPLVASQFMRYRKSLKLLQAYEIHSKFVAWDEKWAYLEHRFFVNDELIATGYVKGLFRGAKGNLPMEQMFTLGGQLSKSPPFPKWIESFNAIGDEAGH
jgi:acyl-CoA thioesterase FadM